MSKVRGCFGADDGSEACAAYLCFGFEGLEAAHFADIVLF